VPCGRASSASTPYPRSSDQTLRQAQDDRKRHVRAEPVEALILSLDTALGQVLRQSIEVAFNQENRHDVINGAGNGAEGLGQQFG
jgi:hypothetical protein